MSQTPNSAILPVSLTIAVQFLSPRSLMDFQRHINDELTIWYGLPPEVQARCHRAIYIRTSSIASQLKLRVLPKEYSICASGRSTTCHPLTSRLVIFCEP